MKENLTADKKIGAEKYNVSDLKLCIMYLV